MKKILVSVIVPVYNSSKYLANCIKNLINQSYDNIEMIFVNDGSTDNSLEILNKYKYDKRVKIINQENKGANLARVNGLKHCHGNYVMFVDSDDYILPNTIEDLVNIIIDNEVDIVKFRFINYDVCNVPINGKINKNMLLEYLLTSNELNNITNEIISRKIINLNDEVFKIKSSTAEDLMINLSFFDRAKNILLINNQYYYYTSNSDSTTKTVDTNKILSSIKDADIVFGVLLKYSEKWKLNSSSVISKMQFDNIYAVSSKIIRIIENHIDDNTIKLINKVLDSIRITKYDYKRIIIENEKHLLNRKIYTNILGKKYKKAKFFLNIKKAVLRIIK